MTDLYAVLYIALSALWGIAIGSFIRLLWLWSEPLRDALTRAARDGVAETRRRDQEWRERGLS